MDEKRKEQEINKARETKINKSIKVTDPVINAAYTINSIYNHDLDIITVFKEINAEISELKKGNITEIEAMLMTQAQTLNILFHMTLTRIPDLNMINQIQVFSDIALKAQNQARKTLAVLAEIKHPRRTTFIKQQNNALNQQINNHPQSEEIKKNKKVANELVAEVTHEKMDIGTTFTTLSNNPQTEAVATLNGPSNKRRQGN